MATGKQKGVIVESKDYVKPASIRMLQGHFCLFDAGCPLWIDFFWDFGKRSLCRFLCLSALFNTSTAHLIVHTPNYQHVIQISGLKQQHADSHIHLTCVSVRLSKACMTDCSGRDAWDYIGRRQREQQKEQNSISGYVSNGKHNGNNIILPLMTWSDPNNYPASHSKRTECRFLPLSLLQQLEQVLTCSHLRSPDPGVCPNLVACRVGRKNPTISACQQYRLSSKIQTPFSPGRQSDLKTSLRKSRAGGKSSRNERAIDRAVIMQSQQYWSSTNGLKGDWALLPWSKVELYRRVFKGTGWKLKGWLVIVKYRKWRGKHIELCC